MVKKKMKKIDNNNIATDDKKKNNNVGESNIIHKLISFLKSNNITNIYSLVGILGFIGGVFLVFLNLILYIKNKTIFQYYGLNSDILSTEIHYLIYNIFSIASIIFLFLSIIYLVLLGLERLAEPLKLKEKIIDVLVMLAYVLAINFIFYIFYKTLFLQFDLVLTDLVAYFYFSLNLLPIEIVSCVAINILKNKNRIYISNWNDNVHNYMLRVVFISYSCIIFFAFISYIYTYSLKNKKIYYLIDKNTAIVYATSDYYITLDCNIDNKKLVLYYNTQNKISSNNVKTQYIIFEKVDFENINYKITDENTLIEEENTS